MLSMIAIVLNNYFDKKLQYSCGIVKPSKASCTIKSSPVATVTVEFLSKCVNDNSIQSSYTRPSWKRGLETVKQDRELEIAGSTLREKDKFGEQREDAQCSYM